MQKPSIKIIAPSLMVFMLFTAPWLHRALFMNLKAAWPNADNATAHWLLIGVSVVCAFISAGIAGF